MPRTTSWNNLSLILNTFLTGKNSKKKKKPPKEWEGDEVKEGEDELGRIKSEGEIQVADGRAVVYARGVWEFEAELEDELSFGVGVVVGVLQKAGDKEGFWFGEYFVREEEEPFSVGGVDSSPAMTVVYPVRRCGWFQCDYVQEITTQFKVFFLFFFFFSFLFFSFLFFSFLFFSFLLLFFLYQKPFPNTNLKYPFSFIFIHPLFPLPSLSPCRSDHQRNLLSISSPPPL